MSPRIRHHQCRAAVHPRPRDVAPLIDITLALDLLTIAVTERGDHFVYSPVSETEQDDGYPLHRGALSLVGQALSLVGIGLDDLARLRRHRIRSLYAQGRLPVPLTLGATVVLDAAERSQDRGQTWGEALDQARRVAIRYAELLPGNTCDATVAPTHPPAGRSFRVRHAPAAPGNRR